MTSGTVSPWTTAARLNGLMATGLGIARPSSTSVEGASIFAFCRSLFEGVALGGRDGLVFWCKGDGGCDVDRFDGSGRL